MGGDCMAALQPAIDALGLGGRGYENNMPELIQGESGGDPSAQNPSGASGCGQTMPDTFSAFAQPNCTDIFDPMCNLMASMAYQEAAYGGPVDWSAGGYRNGGRIPGAGGAMKMIMGHAGERVLTVGQNRIFESFVDTVTRGGGVAGLGGLGQGDPGRAVRGSVVGGDLSISITNDLSGLTVQGPVTPEELEDMIDEKSRETANGVLSALGGERLGYSPRYASRRT